MPRFLLILRSDPVDWRDRSPAEIQGVIEAFERWAGQRMAEGSWIDGKKLCDDQGRVLQKHGGSLRVTDGPYGETKEIVGGIHILQADSFDHAVEMCREHPEFGIAGTVEIRRLEEH